MGLALELEKKMHRLINIEIERTKIETELFYNPALQKDRFKQRAEKMRQRAAELFNERQELWRELFESKI